LSMVRRDNKIDTLGTLRAGLTPARLAFEKKCIRKKGSQNWSRVLNV
jgi:hypothetical protein